MIIDNRRTLLGTIIKLSFRFPCMPVEIYGEYVELRELFIALLITTAFAFAGYLVAPYVITNEQMVKALSITFGVLGAFIGGAIASLFIEPKREVLE